MKESSETILSPVYWIAQPKSYFLLAAFLSFIFSIYLWFGGEKDLGLFVGLWVPSICSAGALILKGGSHE